MAEENYASSLLYPAQLRPYQRRSGDPVSRPLKVYTLDSDTARADGAVATVEVPWEPLAPGPSGALFIVNSQDGQDENEAVDLDDPRILIRGGLDPSLSDPRFHQQMVYGVCANVYGQFQKALGRWLTWGFPSRDGRLRICPHAPHLGANAAYDKDRGCLEFGYFPVKGAGAGRNAPGRNVFTCLSHDVVTHEFTHALLDGLRSRFAVPTSRDVLGFHEGFADLVAVFQHFMHRDLLEAAIRQANGKIDQSGLLVNIAQQFGLTTRGEDSLRCAVAPPEKRYSPNMPIHEMGSVLVSAVFDAFRQVFRRKTEPFIRLAYSPPSGYMVAELVSFLAAQASELAEQFLAMCIRAIDYCPPIDLQLGEYLRAVITADRELSPGDPWGYRDALIGAFAGRGIYPPGGTQMSEDSLVWRGPLRALESIWPLHFANLRFAGDPSLPAGEEELIRQAQALSEFITRPHITDEFGLSPLGEPVKVDSMRTSRRVGPEGQVLFDLVAEVTQRRWVRDPETGVEAKFFGASTLIIGPQGEIRFIISKNAGNEERLQNQLAFQRSAHRYWSVEDTAEGRRYRMCGHTHRLAHESGR